MQGDDKVRYCSHCKLNVYNLPEMTMEQIKLLMVENEGRLCVRMYQRKDGRVMSKDCPVPFAKARRRMALMFATALFFLLGALGYAGAMGKADPDAAHVDMVDRLRAVPGLRTVVDWISPPATAGAMATPYHVTGKVAGPGGP